MILCLSSLLKLSYISLKFSWENFVVYQHEDITIQQLPYLSSHNLSAGYWVKILRRNYLHYGIRFRA